MNNHFEQWPAIPHLKRLDLNKVGHVSVIGIRNLKSKCPLLSEIHLYSHRGSNMNEIFQAIAECFPDIVSLTLRGGRTDTLNNLSQYLQNGKGWRLKFLDLSPNLDHEDILQLFDQHNFLESLSCKYGSLKVTRRVWYEISVLHAYTLDIVEQQLNNRKRLYGESDESDVDFDDDDF